MESFRDLALRPLRRMADYRGRSRRQELIAFWLLSMAVGVVVSIAAAQLGDGRGEHGARVIYQTLLLLPFVPLLARRLHDSGRRGWWVLLGLPAVAANIWRDYADYLEPLRLTREPWEAAWIQVLAALGLMALFGLLILDDDPEPNRYSPNPRYGDPKKAQLA